MSAGTPKQQVAAMLEAPGFQLLHRWLLHRREQLLSVTLTDPLAIAHNRGAVEEVTQLLRHPEVILGYGDAVRTAETAPPIEDGYFDRMRRFVNAADDLETH